MPTWLTNRAASNFPVIDRRTRHSKNLRHPQFAVGSIQRWRVDVDNRQLATSIYNLGLANLRDLAYPLSALSRKDPSSWNFQLLAQLSLLISSVRSTRHHRWPDISTDLLPHTIVNKVLTDIEPDADRFDRNTLIPERLDLCNLLSAPGSHVGNLLSL